MSYRNFIKMQKYNELSKKNSKGMTYEESHSSKILEQFNVMQESVILTENLEEINQEFDKLDGTPNQKNDLVLKNESDILKLNSFCQCELTENEITMNQDRAELTLNGNDIENDLVSLGNSMVKQNFNAPPHAERRHQPQHLSLQQPPSEENHSFSSRNTVEEGNLLNTYVLKNILIYFCWK
jgi:hypothetical protein